MKKCSKCGIQRNEGCFSKQGTGLRSRCKECIKITSDTYYLNNKNKINEKNKQYWLDNKEMLNEWQQQYYIDHKKEKSEYLSANKEILNDRRRIRENNRLRNDPSFRLRKDVSSLIRSFIKSGGSSKIGTCTDKLGYSFQELKEHLERQFEPWMNWSNWGKYDPKTWNDNDPTTWTWQIDHIVPHSIFQYTSMDDDDFHRCWDLSNLRPLSSKQNLLDGITKIRHRK